MGRKQKKIKRINYALAVVRKEQEVQRYTDGLLDATLNRAMADIKELRADVVRLGEIVGSDNADLQTLGANVRSLGDLTQEVALLRRYMGARIEGDKYGPVITTEQAAALRTEPQAGDVTFITPDGERYGPPDGTTVPGTTVNGDFVPDRTDDEQWPVVVMTEDDKFIPVPGAYSLADGTLHIAGTDYKPVNPDPGPGIRFNAEETKYDLPETEGPRCDHWHTYGLMGQRTRCTLNLGHADHHWYMRSRGAYAPPLTRPVLGPTGDTNIATLEGDDEPDATVTSIFHGGVDIPIPTYTTPSEVCAPPPTDLDPIQVAVGALDPEVHFDWADVKRAFVNVLARGEWRRDEGAFEYDTTSDGYRITLTHKNGETLTDMDIHGTLWKIIGGWNS